METSQRNIPTYLGLSIFHLLCCFLPTGIAALICSIRVKDAMRVGDMDGAFRSSRTARLLNIIGIVVGVILMTVVIVLFVVFGHKKTH